MIIIISFLLLAAAIAFLFLVIVFPIWTIIDCAVSQRPNGEKAAWIICMILFGFIAGIFYVIFASKSGLLKFASLSSLISIFILCWSIIAGTVSLAKTAAEEVNQVSTHMNQYSVQLSEEQSNDLRNQLNYLIQRLESPGWREFPRRLDYIDVADQLEFITRDKVISELDYLDIKDMIEVIRVRGLKFFEKTDKSFESKPSVSESRL